ncbi:MAG: flagellar basal body P-ring protein FlgI [Pirellulaceae bacterium]
MTISFHRADPLDGKPLLAWRMLAVGLLIAALGATGAHAALRVGDICRVKGQEENTLQGVGLVVGLKGTGDPDVATTQALARVLSHMGSNLPKDEKGRDVLSTLKDNKNVTLVFVTATVPAAGGSGGDLLDCTVSAIGKSKSLEGGTLLLTPMLGPRPGSQRVYAFAQGQVNLENSATPVNGKIFSGCRLEEDFKNEFVADGKVTLVIDSAHADFRMANQIAELLNKPFARSQSGSDPVAVATGQSTIVVKIPAYEENHTAFVAYLLETPLYEAPQSARVVINRQTGTIVIGADVEISPVAISHKNFTIETGGAFAGLPRIEEAGPTRLKALVDALNALNATPEDLIDILQAIKAEGALHAELKQQ